MRRTLSPEPDPTLWQVTTGDDEAPGPERRFLVFCAVAALVLELYVAVLIMPPLDGPVRETVTRLILLVLAVGVTVTCGRTARRAQGYNRHIWSLFASSGCCWTAGQALLLLFGVHTPNASAGALFLIAVLLVAGGLLAIPPDRRQRGDRLRFCLAASIVLASVTLFCRTVVLSFPPPPVVDPPVPPELHVVASLAFSGLAVVVWVVLLRAGTKGRLPLFLVSGGLIMYAWASVYFFYLSGAVAGSPLKVLDATTALCYLTFILAALSPHAADPRQPAASRTKGRYIGLHSLLVYVPVVTASVVVASAPPRTPDPVVIISGLLVLVLFGIRQMLQSVDNSRLRDDLESRVDDLVQRSSDLRRLALQNERIVQSVVDGVIGVDARGVITFANPAAAGMLGYPRDDLLGVYEHDIFHGGPTDREAGDDCCIVRRALSTGTASVSASESFVAADGRVFPVELAVGPILEEEGITGAVVVFRDVSERLKIDKMKNEFVSVVSHELRTPLTSIRGSLGLLAGGAAGLLSPSADRMVGVALESSERLTRLINDMLDIERIESGTMPVELTDTEPRTLVETAVNSVRGLVGNHRILLDVDRALPLVRADPDRVVQTLTNLIGNAIKFSPPLTTITVAAVSERSFVAFSVGDQGRGIPADKLGRIFERFEQVDSSDSREKGGSGLGLAISRTIVRRHGGDLTVTSTVGGGSTFRFTIPAAGGAGAIVTSVTAPTPRALGPAPVEDDTARLGTALPG